MFLVIGLKVRFRLNKGNNLKLGIKGKTALITGASRGIGMGICKDLAYEGVNIIACSRTLKNLNDLKKTLNDKKHFYIKSDLSQSSGIKKLISQIKRKKKFPDIIINNVGGNLGFTNPLGAVEDWQKVMHLNFLASVEINRHFIPFMKKKKWGRICHISSIAALENQGPPSYCAAKSAINSYVRSLNESLRNYNISITSIMPGPIFTKGGYWEQVKKHRPSHLKKFIKERVAINRLGNISEISQLVNFLCSNQAQILSGECFLADGGQGRSFYPLEF